MRSEVRYVNSNRPLRFSQSRASATLDVNPLFPFAFASSTFS